jgi:hypothetical protein
MTQSLTITHLDRTAMEWIEQEAQRTGMPQEAIARLLIYRGLEVERQKVHQQRFHDLDALAGTWNAEEADAFRTSIADFSHIDLSLWR